MRRSLLGSETCIRDSSYIAWFTKGVIDGLDIPACMKAGAELSSRVIGSFEPY